MSKGVLKSFYITQKWVKTRNAYFASQNGLCEECAGRGEIVHHRNPISASDVLTNPAKCYGWDNLKVVCRVCHELQHSKRRDGLTFNANGDIVFSQTSDQIEGAR
jgi:5-methylcytosine-specific restriction endonuclease McrA